MRYRESKQYTDRPIVEESRENMELPKSIKGKSMKSKNNIKPEGLAKESEIIQKGKESYKNRYKGLLSPEKEIVQEKPGDYKSNRYK